MSTAVELREYADEAMRWARLTGNDRDRLALIELARTWWFAASQSGVVVTPKESIAPEHRAAFASFATS
jgi:hypothetical protein